MKPRIVLDAWALLALLQAEEPASSEVKEILQRAESGTTDVYVSLINLGEVYYRVGQAKGVAAARITVEEIRLLKIVVLPTDETAVFAAGDKKIQHRLSYADAFAAATAETLDATLVTGDPDFLPLRDRLTIRFLRRQPQGPA